MSMLCALDIKSDDLPMIDPTKILVINMDILFDHTEPQAVFHKDENQQRFRYEKM